MDIQKESAKNKLEMFSLEWWKQKGKESYNSFLIEDKLSGASDFQLKEYYKIWLNEELKRIDQRLSDKHPNGNPKGNHILSKPYFRVELLEYQNYILNEVSSEGTQKSKKENASLNDFFPNMNTEQIKKLKQRFSKCRGIEMACFIHQTVKDNHLFIVKNSPKKSLRKFCEVFAEMNKNQYEAVRKLFKYDSYILDNEKHLEKNDLEGKIDTALKVG